MKEKIIETAGEIWRLLGEKDEVSLAQLPKFLDEKNEVIYQALGWLAREDKIEYRTSKRTTYVSLVDSEIEAVQRLVHSEESNLVTTF